MYRYVATAGPSGRNVLFEGRIGAPVKIKMIQPVGNWVPGTTKRIVKAGLNTSNGRDSGKSGPTSSTATVDFPGLRHVTEKGNICYKILWASVILVNLCFCAYQVGDRFTYYLSEPIKTVIAIERVKYLQFPGITLCPANGQYPKAFPIREALSKKYPKKLPSPCSVTNAHLLEYTNFTLADIWRNMSILDYSPFVTFFSLTLSANITQDDFVTDFGTCITYKFPQPLPFYGYVWDLVLITQFDRKMSCGEFISTVWFHDSEEDARNLKSVKGAYVRLGSVNEISLTAQKFNFLSTSKNPCVKSKESDDCYEKCLDTQVEKSLKCRLPFMNVSGIPLCAYTEELVDTFYEYARIQRDIYYNASLGCNCQRKCSSLVYSPTFNMVSTSPNAIATALLISFGDNVLNTVHEEAAYTLISFLCDAGGNLGLFLGLCLVTMLEIMESVFQFIANYFRKLFKPL